MSSPGWVSLQTARSALGEDGLARLRGSGLVRVRLTHDGQPVVTPQIPPLLAANAVSVVQERIEELIGRESADAAVEGFLADCRRLPYCELVGAAAILKEGLSQEICNTVMSRLLEMEPTISEIPADARLAVLFEGRAPVELSADLVRLSIEEGGRFTYGDVVPYMIVSHVMRWAAVVDGRVPDWAMRAVERVASVRIPLYAANFASEERLRHAVPVTSFDLRDGGTVLSGCDGIIEPITDALRHIALNAAEDFADLVGRLLNDDRPSFTLLNRTWLAADVVARLQTPVAEIARSWADALGRKIQARCPEELGHTEVLDGE